jgi:hypothetical protein
MPVALDAQAPIQTEIVRLQADPGYVDSVLDRGAAIAEVSCCLQMVETIRLIPACFFELTRCHVVDCGHSAASWFTDDVSIGAGKRLRWELVDPVQL